MMKGLPASGKSTEALALVKADPKMVRINRDEARKMFYGHDRGADGYRSNLEGHIKHIMASAVQVFLANGCSVVVDDTNLTEEHERYWKHIAKHKKVNFEIRDFTEIDVWECARRDDAREDPVGRLVLFKIAKRHGFLPDSQNKVVDLDVPYVVSDIDGTIADTEHRNWVLSEPSKPWERYFSMMMDDVPREEIVATINDSYPDHPLVLVTARPESYRDITEEWLAAYEIDYHTLIMRRVEDARPDWVVKQELINEFLNKELIDMWFDDRASIIRQVRANGIKVTNVGGLNNEF